MYGLRRKYGAETALAHLETCGEAHRPHRTLVVGLARHTVAEHLQVDLTEQRHGTAEISADNIRGTWARLSRSYDGSYSFHASPPSSRKNCESTTSTSCSWHTAQRTTHAREPELRTTAQ